MTRAPSRTATSYRFFRLEASRARALRDGAAAVVGVAVLFRLFVRPRVDVPVPADAVVALDGDRPRRLARAVALAARGLAPVVVAAGGDAVAPELVTAAELPFEFVSFVPEPSSTRGEARGVARLVRERGWRRVLVVTSTYHVTRTRLIFTRGVECELRFVAAGTPWTRLPERAALEVAKLVLALVFRRSA